MTGQAAQGRFHGVEGFGDGDEAAVLDRALDAHALFLRDGGIAVGHDDGRGHEPKRHEIAAEFL
jgi:uncharacterized Rossmann fold enzyme